MIAPGLPEDEEYLAGLGAAEVVARGEAPEADAVIDLVSYAPEDYGDARVASPLNAAGDGEGHTNVMAVPSTENLDRLAALLADGDAEGADPGHLRARARARGAAGPGLDPHAGEDRDQPSADGALARPSTASRSPTSARGPGRPVVLLHGWPGDRTDYEAVVPLLAPDFEVVVPDLRGFGASDKHAEPPAEAYSAAAQARSVVGLIDELGLERAADRRLRHRQPDRAGDRARHAGAGARARRLAAAAGRGRARAHARGDARVLVPVVPPAVADRGGARRRPRGGARLPRALLAPLVGPGLRARRRAPRPPRRRLRRAGRDDRVDRLVPRGLRDGRLARWPRPSRSPTPDRHADHASCGRSTTRSSRARGRTGSTRSSAPSSSSSSTAPGTSRPSRRPRRSPPRSALG